MVHTADKKDEHIHEDGHVHGKEEHQKNGGQDHDAEEDDDDDHDHGGEESAGWKSHWDLLLALLILITMMVLNFGFHYIPTKWVDFAVHFVAFMLAGWRVLGMAFRKLKRGDIFNEFFLMTVATVGAFVIGSYSEGVAVMVFYCIGEWFQDAAVDNAKKNIKALLDVRPDKVSVIRNGNPEETDPAQVQVDSAARKHKRK